MDKQCNFGATDDDDEGIENIIINKVDGLPNLHPNYQQLDLDSDDERDRTNTNIRTIDELVNDEDLPTSVIVTNLDPRVFKCEKLKVNMFNYIVIIILSL